MVLWRTGQLATQDCRFITNFIDDHANHIPSIWRNLKRLLLRYCVPLPQSHLNLCVRWRSARAVHEVVWRSSSINLDIVIHDNVSDHQLHLLRSEEATWASVSVAIVSEFLSRRRVSESHLPWPKDRKSSPVAIRPWFFCCKTFFK